MLGEGACDFCFISGFAPAGRHREPWYALPRYLGLRRVVLKDRCANQPGILVGALSLVHRRIPHAGRSS